MAVAVFCTTQSDQPPSYEMGACHVSVCMCTCVCECLGGECVCVCVFGGGGGAEGVVRVHVLL